MPRRKILLVTMQPPRMPGMGGEVRTFYFVKTATELGDVTLVSLGGPAGDVRAQPELSHVCERIIEPGSSARLDSQIVNRPSRLRSLAKTLSVIGAPWKNRWANFLTYWLQHCHPSSPDSQDSTQARKLLSVLLHTEFALLSRLAKILPVAAFMFNRSYGQIETDLRKLLEQKTFDVLWIENTLTYPYAKEILKQMQGAKPLVLCNAQNIETLVQQRIADGAESPFARSFGLQQTRLMEKLETEAYRSSDLVIQCSEEDVLLGQKMASTTKFVAMPNGVNTEYFSPSQNAARHQQPTIVFTAGFGYAPNREGLRFFLNSIYPEIQKAVPNCRFVFAGSAAGEMIDELSITDPSIECYCRPDDIRPYFEQAWVYVVPLLSGGGTRLKILEAMSMERAVVSTRLGAEGIPYVDGEHLILADTAESFAGHVIRLLRDERARTKLENAAKCWVSRNYDWQAICGQARTYIGNVIEQYCG